MVEGGVFREEMQINTATELEVSRKELLVPFGDEVVHDRDELGQDLERVK